MSSGMQWAMDREEEKLEQEAYTKLLARLDQFRALPKRDLITMFSKVDCALVDLKDVRLSRKEYAAFNAIQCFLGLIGARIP